MPWGTKFEGRFNQRPLWQGNRPEKCFLEHLDRVQSSGNCVSSVEDKTRGMVR